MSPALPCRFALAGAAVVTALLAPLLITDPAHAVSWPGHSSRSSHTHHHTAAARAPQVAPLYIADGVRAEMRRRTQPNREVIGGMWERFSEDPEPLVHVAWEQIHQQGLAGIRGISITGQPRIYYSVPMGRTVGHIEEYRPDGRVVSHPTTELQLTIDTDRALTAAEPGWPVPKVFLGSGTPARLVRHEQPNPGSSAGWGVFSGGADDFTREAWRRAKVMGITPRPEITDDGERVHVYIVPMGQDRVIGHFEQYGANGRVERHPSSTVRVTVLLNSDGSETIIDGEPVLDPGPVANSPTADGRSLPMYRDFERARG